MSVKGKPGGRTAYKLEEISFMAGIMCTLDEIGAFYKVSGETVRKWCERYPEVAEAVELGRQQGKYSLKRSMFHAALEGDTRMQIWLSKQYLGHRDQIHINYEADLRKLNKMSDAELQAHVTELQKAVVNTSQFDRLPLDDLAN